MKKRIFGIGLSRTGTSSLHYLLEGLGYRSKHYVGELITNPRHDLDIAFDAFSDSPIPLLYPQLDKRYPGSKFILTTRNKNDWLKSMKWLFTHGKALYDWSPSTHQYHKLFYHTTSYNKRILSAHYDNFHEEVTSYFKTRPADLLILNIDEGISVSNVCAFLNIPEKPIFFPKANERRNVTVAQRIKYQINYALRHWFCFRFGHRLFLRICGRKEH